MFKLAQRFAGCVLDDGRKMVGLVTVHGTDNGEFINHAADVGEPIGNRNARFAVVLEGAQDWNYWALHRRIVVAKPDGVH